MVGVLEIEVRVKDIQVDVDGGESEHKEFEADFEKNIDAVGEYESHGRFMGIKRVE